MARETVAVDSPAARATSLMVEEAPSRAFTLSDLRRLIYTFPGRGGRAMVDEAAAYWSAFEEETGEKVEARSIGEYYEAPGDASGLWGLLVLTDAAFRFKYVPSENWLSSMFKRAVGVKSEAVDIRIAREDISSVTIPKRDFLSRIFSPPMQRLVIAEGEKSFAFSFDPTSGLQAALEKAGWKG
jgi:hypothetical protein